MRLIW